MPSCEYTCTCIYYVYMYVHLSAFPLSFPIKPPVTLSLSVDYALQRWHSCISVFAHVFLAEGPGGERDNFLNARAGFASRMARLAVGLECVL